MLNQGLHLTLLNLIALQQRQATANLRSLAALFVLLLLSLLAELVTNRPGKPLAEITPKSAITVEARSDMLSLGLVSELLHHLIEILVIKLDLDLVAFSGKHLDHRLVLEVARLTSASAAINCLTIEVLSDTGEQ